MIKLNIDKSKTYLLACSFGPDSMALLHMLLNIGINLVICHVNYHHRDIADFEEQSLRDYALKNNLKIEVCDTKNMIQSGNFQGWARVVRYQFFKDCYQKYNASGLFVAHHQDDMIETYLLQKKRNNYVSYFGMSDKSIMDKMIIFRPLLDMSKKELLDYVIKQGVPYSIDITNLGNDYQRNRLRHSLIENMTIEQRNQYLNDIYNDNKSLENLKRKSDELIHDDYMLVNEAKDVFKDVFAYALFALAKPYGIISLSKKRIDEFRKMFSSNKSNIKVKLSDDLFYYQEYGKILIKSSLKKYRYILEKPGKYHFNEFDIDFTNASDRNINKSDYPLLIKTAEKNDSYKISSYTCKVQRLFIDWKMPLHLRDAWPLVVNRDGKIIYIPRYREKYVDKHLSKFVIKIS